MNHLQSLIRSLYFYFHWSFFFFLKSLPALQVDGSPFRGIGPENRAGPSNQHKQSLKPLFPKIPHEREMSLAKELVRQQLREHTHTLTRASDPIINQYFKGRKHPISYFSVS